MTRRLGETGFKIESWKVMFMTGRLYDGGTGGWGDGGFLSFVIPRNEESIKTLKIKPPNLATYDCIRFCTHHGSFGSLRMIKWGEVPLQRDLLHLARGFNRRAVGGLRVGPSTATLLSQSVRSGSY